MITRTTTKLLDDLRDAQNADAWAGFDARYRPVLIAFGRRLGFSQEDAAELAQQALADFAAAYSQGRYQRGKGRLSSWLIGIARNSASAMRRNAARPASPQRGGDSAIVDLSNDDELSRIWSDERERAILAQAMAVLRRSSRTDEKTIRAFELFAIRGVPVEQVASECGITVDAVYVAKNRLIKRLRELVRDLTAAFDDEGES